MKKQLAITFLDFDDIRNPLLGAGQAKATVEVGKRLVAKGHSVTVYCAKYPGYKDREENGIFYKHVTPGTKNIRLNNLLYILSMPFIVPTIKANVIVECFTAPVSTMLSPLYTKIPVVGISTTFDAERFSNLYHFPFWIVEKYGAKLYKYFIALTPHLETKMKNFNSKVVTKIIGQGVSQEYFLKQNKKPEFILFLGRIDMNQKGLDLLLDAYAKVSDKISYPLVIAGAGPDKKRVEDRISQLGIDKRVTLVGFADERKKQELLSKSAFVAFPSRNEGFSLFSLEAIASGHRLVSFDIPSLSFAPEKIARKVTPFDVNAYADALLTESNELNQKDAEKQCREFAKHYSWDDVANQFEIFFQNIVSKSL